MQFNLKKQTLDILFISDLHLNKLNVDRLIEQVSASKLHLDYCLIGGDIAECNHQTKTHDEEHML